MKWVNREPVIERNKPEGEDQLLCINACTWRKMVRMSLCSGQQWRRRGGLEGGTDGRSSSETRPSPRVKQAVGTRRVPQGAPARRSGTT